MQPERVRTLLVILFLALFLGSLAACGGGGGSPGQTNTNIQLQGVSTGNLSVTVVNLPSGIRAAVHVSGPGNYAADLAGTQILSGLVPGDYTISAQPVAVGAGTWFPSPATQTVSVAVGATAAASVSYALPAVQLGNAPAPG
ncbi:hypothetical protein AB595_19205 [Massilia sp. WF1]|uniref:hypothetical protein n=1 Tax=unclassified Massilia TaxID=2609279 RepID=UPI00064A6178|nr:MULTISPECIES: hypothetical protein [unclassified Massilia]ALK95601.1 hypothetical protein AM586_04145 [Massilia sp. WG5]KLU35263.1 hypothetical protein AB595_19205 [Massilia sp. WF1]